MGPQPKCCLHQEGHQLPHPGTVQGNRVLASGSCSPSHRGESGHAAPSLRAQNALRTSFPSPATHSGTHTHTHTPPKKSHAGRKVPPRGNLHARKAESLPPKLIQHKVIQIPLLPRQSLSICSVEAFHASPADCFLKEQEPWKSLSTAESQTWSMPLLFCLSPTEQCKELPVKCMSSRERPQTEGTMRALSAKQPCFSFFFYGTIGG